MTNPPSAASNLDAAVVRDFGEEWSRFDQSELAGAEYDRWFEAYFAIFPWDRLPKDATGLDGGCGSGRWARGVAPRVGRLHCVDASPEALAVAKRNLHHQSNCEFHLASISDMSLDDGSMDFGYSLGVLHHVPDTQAGLRSCIAKLKTGAPFLVYLYYAFDNRPSWFRALWRLTDVARRLISRWPRRLRNAVTDVIAVTVYWPLSRTARALERIGSLPSAFPLRAHRRSSLYTMRTDALDRFGTRLELRFTQGQIREMLLDAGLTDIRFSEREPFWCAIGIKR